jgi:hypothetical protein
VITHFLLFINSALATVRATAKKLNITTSLRTSNQTSSTSVHIMLKSVLTNEVP